MVIILPIAINRILEAMGKEIPFEVTIFCDTIFILGGQSLPPPFLSTIKLTKLIDTGCINVILFSTTRRIIPARSVLPSFVLPRPRAPTPPSNTNNKRGGDKFEEAIGKTLSLSLNSSDDKERKANRASSLSSTSSFMNHEHDYEYPDSDRHEHEHEGDYEHSAEDEDEKGGRMDDISLDDGRRDNWDRHSESGEEGDRRSGHSDRSERSDDSRTPLTAKFRAPVSISGEWISSSGPVSPRRAWMGREGDRNVI